MSAASVAFPLHARTQSGAASSCTTAAFPLTWRTLTMTLPPLPPRRTPPPRDPLADALDAIAERARRTASGALGAAQRLPENLHTLGARLPENLGNLSGAAQRAPGHLYALAERLPATLGRVADRVPEDAAAVAERVRRALADYAAWRKAQGR